MSNDRGPSTTDIFPQLLCLQDIAGLWKVYGGTEPDNILKGLWRNMSRVPVHGHIWTTYSRAMSAGADVPFQFPTSSMDIYGLTIGVRKVHHCSRRQLAQTQTVKPLKPEMASVTATSLTKCPACIKSVLKAQAQSKKNQYIRTFICSISLAKCNQYSKVNISQK